MKTPEQTRIVAAAWVAAAAALVASTGEYLMMYSPAGDYGMVHGHAHFGHASAEQVRWGFYLGVLAVPAYILGYWHVGQALAPAGPWLGRAVALLGGYTFAVANVWLGSRAFLAAVVRWQQAPGGVPGFDALLIELDALSEPLVWLLRVMVLVISVLFAYAVATGRSDYPRWLAFFNPMTLLVLVFVSYFAVPPLGHRLAPAAMNVAHLLFFTLAAATLQRRYSAR